jgi:toxin ParE1/3/4
MVNIIWSFDALEDLEEIAEYIARDSEIEARKWVQLVFQKTDRIEQLPFSGRIVPEKNLESIREIIVGIYRIIYEISDDAAEILMVLHGSRLLEFE